MRCSQRTNLASSIEPVTDLYLTHGRGEKPTLRSSFPEVACMRSMRTSGRSTWRRSRPNEIQSQAGGPLLAFPPLSIDTSGTKGDIATISEDLQPSCGSRWSESHLMPCQIKAYPESSSISYKTAESTQNRVIRDGAAASCISELRGLCMRLSFPSSLAPLCGHNLEFPGHLWKQPAHQL